MTSQEREVSIDAGSAELDALVGRTIGGRFLITGRIARGGMACVYAATQTQLNRAVAVKVMRPTHGTGELSADDFRKRFLREASILSRLQHPNLVTLLDYGQITELTGDHYYIAMEYLRGETLARRFRTRERLTVAESIRIARQIGRGLREAHRQGFIHRDLKPSNIMLVPDADDGDIVKLIDFGIGKVIEPSTEPALSESEEERTRVGLLLGSPRYMAPEQIRGEAVEARTDLYALGIILFQALTGRVPFQGKSEMDTLLAQCTHPPPPLNALLEEPVNVALSELVRDLLKKRPADRPTIHEFLERLANVERELFDGVWLAGQTLTGARIAIPSEGSVPPASWPAPLALSGRGEWNDSAPPTRPLGNIDSALARAEAPSVFDLSTPPASKAAPPSTPPLTPPLAQNKKIRAGFWSLAPLALLLWFALRSDPTGTAVARPQASSSAAVASARASFSLRLDSTPPAALVSENEVALGPTPLELTIDRTSVRSAARRFTIDHSGYARYTFEQLDSEKDVAVSVQLVPEAVKSSAVGARPSRARGNAARSASGSQAPPGAAPPARPGLDINLNR